MAEPSPTPSNSSTGQSQTGSPTAALGQIKGLLSAKDDTSRFVGLAILKSVLDNRPELQQDVAQVKALWEAISAKFLDKLLRARENQKITREEAKDMVDIAVAVIHTFAIILPTEYLENDKLIRRSTALTNALVQSSAEVSVLILQTLLTIVSLHLGALQFMAVEYVSPLTEIAHQQPLVLDIFSLAWSNASTGPSEVPAVRASINRIIPMLLNSFRDTDAVTFLAFIGDTLTKLPPEAAPDSPSWLKPLIASLRVLVTKRPTVEGRTAYSNCAAALLQTYPNICPNILFQGNEISGDEKPFSYLFINLLLIDIRSSFPSLLSKLNSPEYAGVSKRLAAAFDIISSFVSFLVRSLDDDSDRSSTISFNMPPDLLLRLRKEISETISLTIEYLRDRWDFAVAGVAGLHHSARTETAVTSEGARLTLTWDSMNVDVSADPLVLSSIRTLAIWLREDDNESLREETVGLTDMFTELYKNGSSAALNFRFPVLMALESTLHADGGADAFINQGGWEILSQDLAQSAKETFQREAHGAQQQPNSLIEANASRGIEIVRVLLVIVDQQSSIQESWMTVVKAAASMKYSESICHPLIMELQLAILQLTAALLSSAASGMQKRYVSCTMAILGLVAQLRVNCDQFSGLSGQEFRESLDDITISLENLR